MASRRRRRRARRCCLDLYSAGTDADIEDNIDSESEASQSSKMRDCAGVRRRGSGPLGEEGARTRGQPGHPETPQGQVQHRAASTSARVNVPEVLNTYPF